MAQIPIYPAAKINEVGNPVPIVSPENTAGVIMGVAVENMGKALFGLSKVLAHEHGQVEKERERLEATTAMGIARQKMVGRKAQSFEQGFQPGDKTDGTSGVNRFKEVVNADLDDIADGLSSDRTRNIFRSLITDDLAREEQVVWANELHKKELTIKPLIEKALNARAAVVRLDSSTMVQQMAEVKSDVANSEYISEADKGPTYIEQQKVLAREAISGLLDKNQFDSARDLLIGKVDKLGAATVRQALDQEARDKEMVRIRQAEEHYYTKAQQKDEFTRRALERKTKAEEDAAVVSAVDKIAAAGNDSFAREKAVLEVMGNPKIQGPMKDRLANMDTFMKYEDDAYTARFYTAIGRTKSDNQIEAMKSVLRADLDAGGLSLPKYTELLKAADAHKATKKDPSLSSYQSALEKELMSMGGKPSVFIDPTSGLQGQEYNLRSLQMNSEFNKQWSRHIQGGGSNTADAMDAVAAGVARQMLGRKRLVIPPGFSPGDVQTPEDTKKTLNKQLEYFGNYSSQMTPKQMNEFWQKLQQLDKFGSDQRENEGIKQFEERATPKSNTGKGIHR